ncbi:hypothetical protein, partial [Mitsuaria sp. TWR114]|uniref:hypothetical protein n=1 Tax=Mitsuaria sp. TWR114 TaxID=2601731 RepID=UPI001C9B1429
SRGFAFGMPLSGISPIINDALSALPTFGGCDGPFCGAVFSVLREIDCLLVRDSEERVCIEHERQRAFCSWRYWHFF